MDSRFWPAHPSPWEPRRSVETAEYLRESRGSDALEFATAVRRAYHPGSYGYLHWGFVADLLSGVVVKADVLSLHYPPGGTNPAHLHGPVLTADPVGRVLDLDCDGAARTHIFRDHGSIAYRSACGGMEIMRQFVQMIGGAATCVACLVVTSQPIVKPKIEKPSIVDFVNKISKPVQLSMLDLFGEES